MKSRVGGEKRVKSDRGCWSEGRPHPKDSPGRDSKVGAGWNTPCSYWNEDVQDRWLGLENISQILVNSQLVTALIDNGARMNTVTPLFVKRHGLEVGSIDDLNRHRGRIPVSCSGGYYTEPLGYVLIRVQLPGIPLYDEEQVALVI